MLVLAGDIGGTNSRLALFELEEMRPVFERTYPSATHESLDVIVAKFLAEAGQKPDNACFGIAGPIENDVSRATNLPWVIDARRLEQHLGLARVHLVNDFHAAALGVTLVGPGDLVSLGGGPRQPHGPIAVLGAGTGLGEAFLFWSETADRYRVISSEGGHADFAPRTPLETGLAQYLAAKYGRVSYERVLSGNGLIDIFGFLAAEPSCRVLLRPDTTSQMAAEDPAAVISRRGMDGSDPICQIALTIFSSALGAVAGNLALYFLATGGVFVGGGIAPRIAPYLQRVAFRDAFDGKGRLQHVVSKIPAFVVTHPQVGLLGAAAEAARL